jgi:uncharacterized Fe-S cluster protein YjdI
LKRYIFPKQTGCECVRSEAAVFLINMKPFETYRAELQNSCKTVSGAKETVCSFTPPAKRHPPAAYLGRYIFPKHTGCECVRSDAAVFLINKKPFETNRAEP